MKKRNESSMDDVNIEMLSHVDGLNTLQPPVPEPTSSSKSTPGFLRPVGLLLLIISVLGLIFAAPMLQGIPFIATLRNPLEGSGLLDLLGSLPSILWIGMLLVAILCLRGSTRKTGTARANASPKSSLLTGNNVENWPGGLKPERADAAMKLYLEHLQRCPDAFPSRPGIRLMKETRDNNAKHLNAQHINGTSGEEKIYTWFLEGDHYVIDIDYKVTEGKFCTMHYTMDSQGTVYGKGQDINGVPVSLRMPFNMPLPLAHNTKGDNCTIGVYITLLGG